MTAASPVPEGALGRVRRSGPGRGWALSLRARITGLMVAVVGLVLFASTSLGIRISERGLEASLRAEALALARELAAGITTRRELRDAEDLGRQVQEVLAARGTLRRLSFYALDGGRLQPVASNAASPRVPDAQEAQGLMARGEATAALQVEGRERVWRALAPIRIAGQIAGAVGLDLSLAASEEVAAAERRQAYLLMAGSAILLVVALSLFMRRAVEEPIRRLVASMGQAEAGDLGARADVRRPDEVGQLAAQFNRMLARIREAHEENLALLRRIENFNQELRERVQTATAELVQTNRQLFEAQRQVGRAERLAAVGEVAAMVAHEVGGPLTSISGHIQILATDASVAPEARERLRVIEGHIARAVEILQAFLTSARTPDRPRAPVGLNAVLEAVLALVRPGLAPRGVTLATALAADVPRVVADADQLQQVFLNLVTNAVDAMPGGGRLRVESRSARPDAWAGPGAGVEIVIRDTGAGMPPEQLKRIFEPFFTTKDIGKGTGLGLAVCQRIVRAHGGEIHVASEPGRGARVTVRLPAEARG